MLKENAFSCPALQRAFPDVRVQEHYSGDAASGWQEAAPLLSEVEFGVTTVEVVAGQQNNHGENKAPGKKNPHYWGVKDTEEGDPAPWAVRQREQAKQKLLASLLPASAAGLPAFFGGPDRSESALEIWRQLRRTPEIWFGTQKSSGAKAHLDGHVQPTMSLQLSGRKRWSFWLPEERGSMQFLHLYEDGMPEKTGALGHGTSASPSGSPPLHLGEVVLSEFDAVFFPPATVHATENVGEVCSLSATFQFLAPSYWPARYFYRYWHRIRLTADVAETWAWLKTFALFFSGEVSPSRSPDAGGSSGGRKEGVSVKELLFPFSASGSARSSMGAEDKDKEARRHPESSRSLSLHEMRSRISSAEKMNPRTKAQLLHTLPDAFAFHEEGKSNSLKKNQSKPSMQELLSLSDIEATERRFREVEAAAFGYEDEARERGADMETLARLRKIQYQLSTPLAEAEPLLSSRLAKKTVGGEISIR